MFGLAFALELESQGFGVFGESLFWNTSPLLQGGGITTDFGWWVREEGLSEASTKFIGQYSSDLVVSCRFSDVFEQGVETARLVHWLNTDFKKYCILEKQYEDFLLKFKIIGASNAGMPVVAAVDTEGRLVQEVRSTINYSVMQITNNL